MLPSGYTHKIQVEVNGHFVLFEPNKELNYRAVLNVAQQDKGLKVEVLLLQVIARCWNWLPGK